MGKRILFIWEYAKNQRPIKTSGLNLLAGDDELSIHNYHSREIEESSYRINLTRTRDERGLID